jgi:hypothetical protein
MRRASASGSARMRRLVVAVRALRPQARGHDQRQRQAKIGVQAVAGVLEVHRAQVVPGGKVRVRGRAAEQRDRQEQSRQQAVSLLHHLAGLAGFHRRVLYSFS